jgi:hypothetical protein
MNRGCKHLIAPAVCGAILLALLTLSTASGQRGGAGGGGGGDNSGSRGAAGLDRTLPGQEPQSPPVSTPAVKAKLDHDQNLKDAARLAQLANEVKQDLESSGELTLSVASLKKAEEMAKLSKKLHDRMKTDYASAPKSPRVGDATNRFGPKQ